MRYGFQLVHSYESAIIPKDNAVAELKYDGTMIEWDGPQKRLWNRSGSDTSARFPALFAMLSKKVTNAVLIGEVVVFDKNGVSDFNEILHRGENTPVNRIFDKTAPAKMVLFDCLEIDGKDLTALPYKERFSRIASIVMANSDLLMTPKWWDIKELEIAMQYVREHNEEGLVIKHLDRPYKVTVGDKRTDNWIKWKAWLYMGMQVIRCGPTGDGHGFTAFISNKGREQEVAVQRVSDQERLTKKECTAIVVRYLEEGVDGALRQPTCKGVHKDVESAMKAAKWDA